MIPTLLICVIFLCGLQDAVLCQRGHCAGSKCITLFQVPGDFPSAQKSCGDSGGQVLVLSAEHVERAIGGLDGSYWLKLQRADGATRAAAAGHQNCPSILVEKGGNFTVSVAPCSEELDGFLCEFTFDKPCGGLRVPGAARVKYATNVSSDVNDWESFPQGTIAEAEKAGSKYLDSRHVCFSSAWIPAPWSCEVMRGGCDHNCSFATHACVCPAGQALHPNGITCTEDPCLKCQHGCQKEGDTVVCTCRKGYLLARDGTSCVDANECDTENPCTAPGEVCENTEGGFQCRCKDGFDEQDGVCEDFSNCFDCEHMLCEKTNGVYGCACRKGYRVSPTDPTKCQMNCSERECPASCIPDPDKEGAVLSCECLYGYVHDVRGNTTVCTDIDECAIEAECDHKCENLFGGYRCVCDEGFRLEGEKCKPVEVEEEEDGGGSGSAPPPNPTEAVFQPSASVPSYIKTGSVLGIAVFMALCAALLYLLLRHTAKRCGRFELSSLKNPDIFHLQQVTTETYKRLSLDRQFKNDAQIL